MPLNAYIQIAAYVAALLVLAKPLGTYIARVYQRQPVLIEPAVAPLENWLYRVVGVRPAQEMGWTSYATALLTTNLLGLLGLFLLQRVQAILPLNPQGLGNVASDLAFNTAASFATNTNWQSYAGETTLSYLTQMVGVTVQNFMSAATGMAVLVAVTRGLTRTGSSTLGNFWVDFVRGILYILLPLSLILSLVLVSQGVVQTLQAYPMARSVQPQLLSDGVLVETQALAVGPVASQVAIKQLGTNGGGFLGANSAHPFENPTPLSNFAEMLAILLIPAALCFSFGALVGDARQGRAILAAMLLILIPLIGLAAFAEYGGNPAIGRLGVDQAAGELQPGGNMEGKEVRFGIADSALWAVATSAASNGSVNSMHDSFTPLGGLVPLWLIQLGEVAFGGVGSGLYGMLMFATISVFVGGLMVGRTPEYLGKKIEAFEMKMASLAVLIPPALVLVGAAAAVTIPEGLAAVQDPGPHGLTEVLYAFSSAGNNNGSAFAGLGANRPFYNVTLGLAMLFARYWLIVPVLAFAGSLAAKKKVPASLGTLPTDSPVFVGLLVGVVLLVGALTFLPALALGPIAEHFLMVKP